jgi:DNA-binding transcriptional LysR family regulator
LRLDLLQAFVVLADELHFTRTAERLFMSQSGLSRRIRQVERVLGTDLVSRTTRSVELTPAGVALLPHAQAVLTAGRNAAAATKAASGQG